MNISSLSIVICGHVFLNAFSEKKKEKDKKIRRTYKYIQRVKISDIL